MTMEELQALHARMQAALPPGYGPAMQEDGTMVVEASSLLEVGRYLRDEEGFDYLSNVSGVDWVEQGRFDVVYHLFAMRRGERLIRGEDAAGPLGPVVLKVCVPRENAVVPSVVPIWIGALWQERETYDMLGIRFEGHPDLRRIYLWDEFEDHPLRKDYVPEEA